LEWTEHDSESKEDVATVTQRAPPYPTELLPCSLQMPSLFFNHERSAHFTAVFNVDDSAYAKSVDCLQQIHIFFSCDHLLATAGRRRNRRHLAQLRCSAHQHKSHGPARSLDKRLLLALPNILRTVRLRTHGGESSLASRCCEGPSRPHRSSCRSRLLMSGLIGSGSSTQ